MNVRATKTWLWLLSVTLAAAAAGVWAWAIAAPLTIGDAAAPEVGPTSHSSAASSSKTSIATLRFDRFWRLDLQRPLYDPVRLAPVVAPPPPPPPLRLRLLGTVIEGDDAQAMLVTSDGAIAFHRVGDTVEQATIRAIEPDRVKLEYFNKATDLTINPP